MIVELKLKEIADSIADFIVTPESKNDMGLYTGTAGLLMFMAYYSHYSGEKKYKQIADDLLEECCNGICNGIYIPSFCDGLSGILYGLNHLNQINFIQIDLSEVHKGYSELLRSYMNNYALSGQIDFMHEATGIALYFSQNGEPSDLANVGEVVKILDHIAEHEDGVIKWLTDLGNKGNKTYNISMSHGMSAIVVFLSLCIEKKIEHKISSRLLNGVVNYILSQELEYLKVGSFFPYSSIESIENDNYKSRLAWCYGDLGVAIALWRAGNVTGNEKWKAKAEEVMEYARSRRNLESERVFDACICHGTAGIAQIFRRMYYNTGNEKFLETANFWIFETLKFAIHNDGKTAGFKMFWPTSSKWISTHIFLEGIAGIGLALLSSQGGVNYSSWDSILLLS